MGGLALCKFLLCLASNVVFGFFMMCIVWAFFNLDIPDEIVESGVFLGVLIWIPYGIYKLIIYPINKQIFKKEKIQREMTNIKHHVMRIGEYKDYDEIILNIECQQKLHQCYQSYFKLQSYKEINSLHNNRVDKVFISTLNYLLEINKQCEEYDEEIENKKKEIIDKLLNFLIKEEEIYRKEYVEMKNKDRQVIKNELDKFSNTIDAYMDFEDIGKED